MTLHAERKLTVTKDEMLEAIDKMTVLELHELVEALKDKYGVTAAAPMMAFAGPMPTGDAGGAAAEDEKATYDVIIAEVGQQKIALIKAVKEALGIGLKEAKELVDAAPKAVKTGVSDEEAAKLKDSLEAAGAVIEVK
jgi:large subunit ribosomal protein L7/L12